MPRPSLADKRTEQLLDAFMRCVARYGLDGSTLERISDEADVARPMLRHYLGNRDQMVDALLRHVIRKFAEKTKLLFDSLPAREDARIGALMAMLFDDVSHQPDNASVYQALVAVSHRYDGMTEALMGFVTDFEGAIAVELQRAFPRASEDHCAVVAAGVTATYFNHDAAMPLAPPQAWRDTQRKAAELLIASLCGAGD